MAFDNKAQTALEMFKHYSGIRFLLLPLFFTSMGAIVYAYWTIGNATAPDRSLQTAVAIGGALMSLIFTGYEVYLSKTLLTVSQLLPDEVKELKHTEWFGPVTCLTLLLYFSPLIFWAWRISLYL